MVQIDVQQPSKLTRQERYLSPAPNMRKVTVKRSLIALAMLAVLSTCTATEPAFAAGDCVTSAQIAESTGLKNTYTFTHPGTDVAVELFQSDSVTFTAYILVTQNGCVVGKSDQVPVNQVIELASKTGLQIKSH